MAQLHLHYFPDNFLCGIETSSDDLKAERFSAQTRDRTWLQLLHLGTLKSESQEDKTKRNII